MQHQRNGLHRVGTEQPPEADDVERQEDARRTAPPRSHLGPWWPWRPGRPPSRLCAGPCRATPCSPPQRMKAPPRRTQPAQQHRQQQVGPDAALRLPPMRCEVVAQPRRDEMRHRRQNSVIVADFRGRRSSSESQQQGDADGLRRNSLIVVDLQRIAAKYPSGNRTGVEQQRVCPKMRLTKLSEMCPKDDGGLLNRPVRIRKTPVPNICG